MSDESTEFDQELSFGGTLQGSLFFFTGTRGIRLGDAEDRL